MSQFWTCTRRSPPGSGTEGLTNSITISKTTVPTQMANAIASPPTTVSPGYLTSIRPPSFRSSESPPSQAKPRSSRSASLCRSTPPKATRARRRASPVPTPARRCSSVSMSRWKRISVSMRDSAARRSARRRRRARAAWNQLMGGPVVGVVRSSAAGRRPSSGGAEHRLEAGGEAAPALQLRAEGAAAGGGDLVVAGAPVVVARAPRAGDQAVLLEALERRVEGALVHLQHAVGDLLDALADPPAVHGLERERLQDEQVERAAEDVRRRAGGHGRLRRMSSCSRRGEDAAGFCSCQEEWATGCDSPPPPRRPSESPV